MTKVLFNDECKAKLIEGVNLVTDAVQVTYGPNASNVCIKTPSSVKITKDGATTCKAVTHDDPYVQMGIDLVRDISVKTASNVGDGSSTVCILTRAIVEKFKNYKNPIQLKEELQRECSIVKKELDKFKIVSTTTEDFKKVATLAANGDTTIGGVIATAFEKAGKEGIVQFTESEDVNDRVEVSDGFRIDSGYASPYFVNTPKGECILEDVLVHISDTKMEEVKEVTAIAEKALSMKKSLLLIAPGFDSEITVFLSSNLNLLKSCTVLSPNYRSYRTTLIDDIRALLGESSSCKKVTISRDHTTFTGYDSNEDLVNSKVENLREILKENSLSEIEMDFHKKRLANFTASIATIYVGGFSKVERGERYDRFEDAILATRAAIESGLLPGGGVALYEAAHNPAIKFLFDVLVTPFFLLNKENYRCDTPIKTWEGKNLKTGDIGNLYDMGIVEPYLVVVSALENAVSMGGSILTCECAILNNEIYE